MSVIEEGLVSLEEMDRRVAEWVNSPEGQAQLVATRDAARRESEKIREAMRVDPKTLREPMTI